MKSKNYSFKLTKRDFFSARAITDSHKKNIVIRNSANPIGGMYGAAFGHHVVDRGVKAPHAVGVSSPERAAHLFHTRCYNPHILQFPLGESIATADEFFNSITSNPSSVSKAEGRRIGANRLSILIGKIGVGKSTLISNILILYRRRFEDHRLLPVIIDVEALAGQDASKHIFFTQLYSRFYEFLSSLDSIDLRDLRAIWEEHAPRITLDSDETQSTQYAVALRSLIIDTYLEFGYRIVLILDNIDKYYYLFDRGGFSAEGDQRRLESMERLASIIGEFRSPSGALDGAGLNVVICVRRHTLEYLELRRGVMPAHSLTPDDDGSNVFRVQRSSPEEVINSRIHLLRLELEMAGKIPEKSDEYKALAPLRDKLNRFNIAHPEEAEHKGRSMINDLANLTSHGHRALVDHFAGYRWAFSDEVVLRRFFKTYSPPVITFMLNNKTRYSQVESRFPNLYLVRGDIERPGEAPVPSRLIKPHRHTYWLKFLICLYIFQRKIKKQEVTPTEIMEIFAPSDDADGCFEPHIVELVLGSLAQVDISAVIEPRFGRSLDGQGLAIRDIDLTERGKFLLEKFALDFTYLQLITEDYMLEIPEIVLEEFSFSNVDYGYFAENFRDYSLKAKEMVNIKARWAFLFLEILESSLCFEQQRRQRTFASLRARKLTLPNFNDARQRILGAIQAIATRLDDNEVVKRAKDNLNSARLKQPALNDFFRISYIDENV